jgi:hypothetical protein
VQGAVVWSQANGMAGIKFSGLSDSTTELLQSWIASNRQLLPGDAVKLPPFEEEQTNHPLANCV